MRVFHAIHLLLRATHSLHSRQPAALLSEAVPLRLVRVQGRVLRVEHLASVQQSNIQHGSCVRHCLDPTAAHIGIDVCHGSARLYLAAQVAMHVAAACFKSSLFQQQFRRHGGALSQPTGLNFQAVNELERRTSLPACMTKRDLSKV